MRYEQYDFMKNFLEELKQHFETTSDIQLLDEWKKTAKFDEVGPTVEEFLVNSQQYHVNTYDPNYWDQNNITNFTNPKFTSGFLFPNNSTALCKKQHFQS